MCLSHLMLQNKIQPKCNISKNISYLLGFHNIQPQIFIGKTTAEALILWPLNAKRRLIGKDPDAGKSWRQEEKGMTEEEMVGWYHRLNGHEFEQVLGDGERQGSLVCSSPWSRKSHTQLSNWTETKFQFFISLLVTLIAQLVKNLPAIQETPVQFLGQEDPLEKGQATHSSILGLPLWLSWYRIRLQCGRLGVDPWVRKIPWRRERLPTAEF